jgi:thiamine biosynthesis protein ThiC
MNQELLEVLNLKIAEKKIILILSIDQELVEILEVGELFKMKISLKFI